MMKGLPVKQLSAIERVTGKFGIYQHIDENERPIIRETGDESKRVYAYSTDDQARLMEVQCIYRDFFKNPWFQNELPEILLNYLINVSEKGSEGLMNNYVTEDGDIIEGKPGELLDVFGRGMGGLVAYINSGQEWTGEAEKLYKEKLKVVRDVIIPRGSVHSLAFTIEALAKRPIYLKGKGKMPIEEDLLLIDLTQKLMRIYEKNKEKEKDGWNWPEDKLSYCSGKIPNSFFSAAKALGSAELKNIGIEMLDFLVGISFIDNVFWPIGNNNDFYHRGGERPLYDQQPCEAVIALALQQAYQLTRDTKYLSNRTRVINWFKGDNSKNISLLSDSGGVSDAITWDGINTNQGAEPRIVYLLCESTRFT